MKGYYIVFITAPKERAFEIAQMMVREKVAACSNVVENIASIYWWKGKVENDDEALIIAKTTSERFQDLLSKVKAVHPYEVPEIIAFPIVAGNPDYLKWIEDSTE